MSEDEITLVRTRGTAYPEIRHMAGVRFAMIQATWTAALIIFSVALSYPLVILVRHLLLRAITASSGSVSDHFLEVVAPVLCVALWAAFAAAIAVTLKWTFTQHSKEDFTTVVWYRKHRTDLEIDRKALLPLGVLLFKVGYLHLKMRRMEFSYLFVLPNFNPAKISMTVDFQVIRELKWSFVRAGGEDGVRGEITCLVRDRLIELAQRLSDKQPDFSDSHDMVRRAANEIDASHLGVRIIETHNPIIQVVGERRHPSNLFLIPNTERAD